MGLCTLCGHSLIGNAYLYARRDELPLVRAVAFVGNAILMGMGIDPGEFRARLVDANEEAEE